jgi:UDP-N-acetylglucosamine--N-acetylmuramyl-(pentapeptide) pyrophosphoryl-undecaprenol N-acetylglucosamine transferase
VNVVIAGGGTGGHVFPALAVAGVLAEAGDHVGFVGAIGGPEATAVPKAGYPFRGLDVRSAQVRFSWRTIGAAWSVIRATWRVRETVRAADVVISVGGSASAPAVLAAAVVRRPVIVIEPNSVPGLVNRVAARWASAVATMFEGTRSRLPSRVRVVRTGVPLRPAIERLAPGPDPAMRTAAIAAFGLDPARRTILVTGGSQGALSIDRAVAASLALLGDRRDLQILVASGAAHAAEVERAVDPAAALLVRVVPFIDRMDLALAVADMAVSRAGGGVAELAACAIPAILVPYPHATEDHQTANARELVSLGAARMIDDADLTARTLAGAILELMEDDGARRVMSAAMRAWSRPGAAGAVASLAREVAR